MIGTLTPAASISLPVRKTSFPGRNICRASVQTAAPPLATCKPAAGTLYEVLRVNKNASPVEIKAAYRNLAKVFHPDSSRSDSSDGRDFIEIREAYSTLSDPAARAVYDLTLAVGSRRRQVGYAAGAGDNSGFYRTRRWETDQCW